LAARGYRNPSLTQKKARLFAAKLESGEISVEVGTNFTLFAEEWLSGYSAVEKSGNSQHEDRSAIERHLLPAFGELELADIRKSHLLELRTRLATQPRAGGSKPLHPKTVNNILGLARKMLNTAVDWDLLPANPWVGVKPLKSQDSEMDYWTPEERDTFLARAIPLDEPFARLVATATHTGLRLGELAGLRREDLDFANRLIHVRRQYSLRLGRIVEHTKTKSADHVPMNQVVIAAVDHAHGLDSGESIFPLSLFHNARRRLGGLCKKTGIRSIRFHDLRHTFASCLAMAGVDLMVIQKLMRHKSYQMTLRYSHLHPDHIRGATDCLVHADRTRELSNISTPAETLGKWRTLRDSNSRPSGSKNVA
jgi:integrase